MEDPGIIRARALGTRWIVKTQLLLDLAEPMRFGGYTAAMVSIV